MTVPLTVTSQSGAAGSLLQVWGPESSPALSPCQLHILENSLGSNTVPGPGRSFASSFFVKELPDPLPPQCLLVRHSKSVPELQAR